MNADELKALDERVEDFTWSYDATGNGATTPAVLVKDLHAALRAALRAPVTGSRPEVVQLVNEALESMNEADYQLAERILRSVSAVPVTGSREREAGDLLTAVFKAVEDWEESRDAILDSEDRSELREYLAAACLAAAPVVESQPAEAKALEIVQRLADWSRKYPRGTVYNASGQPSMDALLIAMEEDAKALLPATPQPNHS